jgi:hypothetical protein
MLVFRGTAPFSEPESRAIQKAIEEEEEGQNGKLAAFLTFHAYGQYIFVPTTYKEGNTETFEKDIAVANKFREKIHQ